MFKSRKIEDPFFVFFAFFAFFAFLGRRWAERERESDRVREMVVVRSAEGGGEVGFIVDFDKYLDICSATNI